MEAGAAIHGPFDQLEPVNVSFNRSIAPFVFEGGSNGSFLSAEMFRE